MRLAKGYRQGVASWLRREAWLRRTGVYAWARAWAGGSYSGDSARPLQWRASSVRYSHTSVCARTGGVNFSYLAFLVSGSLLNSASQRSYLMFLPVSLKRQPMMGHWPDLPQVVPGW